jgi:hypothetical protein
MQSFSFTVGTEMEIKGSEVLRGMTMSKPIIKKS